MSDEIVEETFDIEVAKEQAVSKLDEIVEAMVEIAGLSEKIEQVRKDAFAPLDKSVVDMEAEFDALLTPEIRAAKQAIIDRYLPVQGQLQEQAERDIEGKTTGLNIRKAILEGNIEHFKEEVESVVLKNKGTLRSTVRLEGKPYGGVYFKEALDWDTKALEGAAMWEPKLKDFATTVPPKVVFKKI
jgi:hypothetical protein